jgi:5-methylcytosine-specific restriction endonuclease McrA
MKFNTKRAKSEDYVGKKFSELTVVSLAGQDKRYNTLVKCLCDCGTIKTVLLYDLKNDRIHTCGCKKTTQLSKIFPEINPVSRGTFAQDAINYYKWHAKRRGYEWKLEPEEAYKIMLKQCFYCGTSPTGKIPHLGIDRLDNLLGYYTDNCVPCCGTCNKAKQSMTVDEFYQWIERVYLKKINEKSTKKSICSTDEET